MESKIGGHGASLALPQEEVVMDYVKYKYERGSRLPVPKEVRSAHFLYLAQPPALEPDAVAKVVAVAKQFVEDVGLEVGEIQVLHSPEIEKHGGADALAAVQVLETCFAGLRIVGKPSVLVCHWASVHQDESFEGSSFASLVLHTGPEPYVLQMFHSEYSEVSRQPTLTSSTRVLAEGSLFVMDPTTHHMACPAYPADGQLLVLLQAEVQEQTEAERRELLEALPPRPGDKDHCEVFSGLLLESEYM